MKRSRADILREYGPFPGVDGVRRHVRRAIRVVRVRRQAECARPGARHDRPLARRRRACGTAFDGRHLYQIVEDRIEKIDPESGRVLATIPAPGKGGDSGLGGRRAVGRPVPRTQDSSGGPANGRRAAHDRIEPLRHRRDVGRRRAVARHLGSRPGRPAAHRSANRPGARADRHAGRRRRIGSNPTATTASTAAAATAARCAPYVGPREPGRRPQRGRTARFG